MKRAFKLGQRVELADHLVRCHVDSHLMEEALEAAMVVEHGRDSGKAGRRTLWLPASYAEPKLYHGLQLADGTLDRIAEGVIVRRVLLQQGFSEANYYEPTTWMQTGSTKAYHVAYDLNRLPVPVRPDMVIAWTADEA